MKKMILNNGFSYKELLIMKRYFRAFRIQNYAPDDPMVEGEDFKGFIFSIAKDSFRIIPALTYLNLFMTIGTYLTEDDLRGPFLMFVICLFGYVIAVHLASQEYNLKMITITKLLILHIRGKIKLWL